MKPSDMKPLKSAILMEYLDNPKTDGNTDSMESADFVFCSSEKEMVQLREEIRELLMTNPEWREEWKTLKMMRKIGKNILQDNEDKDNSISDADLCSFIDGTLQGNNMQSLKEKILSSKYNRLRFAMFLDAYSAANNTSINLPEILAEKALKISSSTTK